VEVLNEAILREFLKICWKIDIEMEGRIEEIVGYC
jgi:hypothetical protein